MPRFLLAVFIGLACSGPLSAGPKRTNLGFDVFLLGLKVGELALAGHENSRSYAVSAALRTTGLAGALARVQFQMSASGRVRQGRLEPLKYLEDINTGRRASSAVLDITPESGHVALKGIPIDHAPNGFLDPASALYAIMRNQDRSTLCDINQRIFDGIRTSHIHLSLNETDCRGGYERIAGYSAQELAERSRFPLSLTYVDIDGLWHLDRVKLISLYGPVTLRRK